MEPNPPAAALYVATDLDHFEAPEPHVYAADVTVSGRAYRRLDPPYYAWLRRQMGAAKRALDAKRITAATFDTIRALFNAIHAWSLRAFGEAALVAAAKATDAAHYQPPRPDDDLPLCGARLTPRSPAPSSGHAFPSDGDFTFAEPVAPDAVAKVDAIRAEALALGWTEPALYRNRSDLRFPYGGEYGLVCFLDGGARIGAVTRETITIEHARGTRGSFPNPAVPQPWRRAAQAVPV